MSFEELGLNAKTLQGIADVGYTEPTPIQAQAIPLILAKKDVIALAQTGSGKTASFILPLLDLLTRGRAKARMPRSLIIEPTRELAAQVEQDFAVYGKYHGFTVALLIGGESFVEQEKKLSKGVDVLIVTPGRLLDMYERGKILLNDVKMFVIDEADRMLDMGFIPDIERIASLLPPHQTALFSATMADPIRTLTQKFLHNPEEINISSPKKTATNIQQYIVRGLEKDKKTLLESLLKMEKPTQAIVFCNRKSEVDLVLATLKKNKFHAGALHGDLTQINRNETLKAFKEGSLTFLIASDVAARGLDVENLPLVINYDVPTNPEDYIHRVGRTGRAGKTGKAFTLVSPREEKHIELIYAMLNTRIEEYKMMDSSKKVVKKLLPSVAPLKKVPMAHPLKTPMALKVEVGFGDYMPAFMQTK